MTISRYIFARIDISNHDLPSYFQAEFHWFFDTCESVLSDLSALEIEQLVIDVDSYIYAQNPWRDPERLMLTQAEIAADIDSYVEDYIEIHPNRIHAILFLRLMKEGARPTEITSVQGATWEQCFAASLLSLSLFALDQENYFGSHNFEKSERGDFFESISEYIGQYAVCGMELLTIIRSLTDFLKYKQPKENIRKALLSDSATSAAKARWADSRAIKDSYITWYRNNAGSGLFSTRTKAAEIFHSTLSADDQRTLGGPEVLIIELRKSFKNTR